MISKLFCNIKYHVIYNPLQMVLIVFKLPDMFHVYFGALKSDGSCRIYITRIPHNVIEIPRIFSYNNVFKNKFRDFKIIL